MTKTDKFAKELKELLKKYDATLNVESHINVCSNLPFAYVWFKVDELCVNVFERVHQGTFRHDDDMTISKY